MNPRLILAVLAVVLAAAIFPALPASAVDPEGTDDLVLAPPDLPTLYGVFSNGQIVPLDGDPTLAPLPEVPEVTGVIGFAAAPGGGGYLATDKGRIITLDPAPPVGGVDFIVLDAPVVDIDVSPQGGVLLTASDGGVFALGGMGFFGSVADLDLDQPIVSAAITPSGLGYVLLGDDGGTFNLGDSKFVGSRAGQLAALTSATGVQPLPIDIRFAPMAPAELAFVQNFGDGDVPRGTQAIYPSQIMTYSDGTDEVLGDSGGNVGLLGADRRYEVPVDLSIDGVSGGFAFGAGGLVYGADGSDVPTVEIAPAVVELIDIVRAGEVINFGLGDELSVGLVGPEGITSGLELVCTLRGITGCNATSVMGPDDTLTIEIELASIDTTVVASVPATLAASTVPNLHSPRIAASAPLVATTSEPPLTFESIVDRLVAEQTRSTATFSYTCSGLGMARGAAAVTVSGQGLGARSTQYEYRFDVQCVERIELALTCETTGTEIEACVLYDLQIGDTLSVTATGSPAAATLNTKLTMSWDGAILRQTLPSPPPPDDTVQGSTLTATVECVSVGEVLLGARGQVFGTENEPARTLPIEIRCTAPETGGEIEPPQTQVQLAPGICIGVVHFALSSQITPNLMISATPTGGPQPETVTVTMSGPGLITPTKTVNVAADGKAAPEFGITTFGTYRITIVVVTLDDGSTRDVTAQAGGAQVVVTGDSVTCP